MVHGLPVGRRLHVPRCWAAPARTTTASTTTPRSTGCSKLSKTQKSDADREKTIKEIERIAIGRDLALAPTYYRTAYRVFDSNKWTGVGLDFFERPTLETASLK